LVIAARQSLLVTMTLARVDHDLVSRLETTIGWSLEHNPGRITSRNDRQREIPLAAKTDPDIKMIQAAG